MRASAYAPAPDRSPVTRRTFLAGAATVSALAGLEGILAARRAPAFAQGTKLHIVRWVDFIPEADVELKRQAPEASKALGAEVQFEFINANDLQPRITAAVQSGSGADIIQMLWNWPQLYRTPSSTSATWPSRSARRRAGYYDVFTSTAKVGGKWLAVPHGTGGNAVAYRRSWHNEIGVEGVPQDLGRVARGRQEAQGQGQAGGPGARPQLRRPADLCLPVPVGFRRGGSGPERQEGGHQQQGRRSSR